MTVCEEAVTVSLEELEDDPKGIISLLELSTCERDKWFIVAAHYRRGGNAVAAINVLTSMMKGDPPRFSFSSPCLRSKADTHVNVHSVFGKLGVTEEDMKPASLMISACYGDQAKHTKDSSGLNTPESTRYYQLSLKWLRKVYGTSVSLQNQGSTSGPDSAGPISPVDKSPLPKVGSSRNGDGRLALPPRPSFLPLSRVSLPTSPQHPSVSRIRALEREVESLRERSARPEKAMAESEALKRKYEQELSHERSKRRRIQEELDEISAELRGARRMENYALDTAEREAELRRKAEMREKELIRRVEVLGKGKQRASDGGKVVLLEGRASMFQKSAQAQGDGGGSSRNLGLEPGEVDSSFGGSTLVSSDRGANYLARF